MAKEAIAVKENTDEWINRLAAVLKAMDAMEQRERSAALTYLKSKYEAEWPRSDY